MKTLWCKNQENPSDRISHAWAPLSTEVDKYGQVERGSAVGICMPTLIGSGGGGGIWTGVDKTGH